MTVWDRAIFDRRVGRQARGDMVSRAILIILTGLFASYQVAAQDAPPFEENGRDIAIRMRNDTQLAAIAKLNGVDFDYSEQKTIDGQAIRIAHYKVKFTLKTAVCLFGQRGDHGISITGDPRNCRNVPIFNAGTTFAPVLETIWKQTDQGWRLTKQQIVRVFP